MGWIPALRFAFVGFVVIAATGCGNSKKTTEPSGGAGETPVVEIDAAVAQMAPPPVSKWACQSDEDCVISCEIADSCCGEACQCELPYHKDQQDEIREANAKKCAVIDADCPQYDCDMPVDDILPVCVDSTCATKRVPRRDR